MAFLTITILFANFFRPSTEGDSAKLSWTNVPSFDHNSCNNLFSIFCQYNPKWELHPILYCLVKTLPLGPSPSFYFAANQTLISSPVALSHLEGPIFWPFFFFRLPIPHFASNSPIPSTSISIIAPLPHTEDKAHQTKCCYLAILEDRIDFSTIEATSLCLPINSIASINHFHFS